MLAEDDMSHSRQLHFEMTSEEAGLNDVILRDPTRRNWLQFSRPQQIVQAMRVEDVWHSLQEVVARAKGDRLYAAGFISYEAAPAFDPALEVLAGDSDEKLFPLLWFGLYESPQEVILPCPDVAARQGALSWRPSLVQHAYDAAIGRIKDEIAAGRTYQVNFSLRLRAPFEYRPWDYFQQLVRAQEPPYGAFFDMGRYAICSASPELFFRLEDGQLTARPMKGTAPRGLTWEEDRAQADWLHHSEKNRAENVMIVDMLRNDLGRVAQIGTVEVPELFAVEKYPSVWQMTSTVRARTRHNLPEVLRALFPCASITGAPKRSTMQIIANLEEGPRRIYTGSIGYMTPDGNAQFNVAIRTVLVDKRAKTAEFGVGGGVVWDSTSEGEWEECATKARVLTLRRPPFRLLETLRWTRQDGYALLKEHLRRLTRSADYFDYTVDSNAINGRLQAAASGFTADAYRVRLLINRDGAMSLETQQLDAREVVLPARVCLAPHPVNSQDVFLYHKTTQRAVYDTMRASCPGFDDVILWNERDEITESCLANVVVELDGERVTPPISSGLLAGTYREWLLEQGLVRERVILRDELPHCTALWLVNSVRGEMRAILESTAEALEVADAG